MCTVRYVTGCDCRPAPASRSTDTVRAVTIDLSPRGREILDAAADVFLELGYGATTVDEIIRRSGGSKATVYKLFGNKEGLFTAVVDGILGATEPPLPVAMSLELDVERTLRKAAEVHLTTVLSERHARLMRMVAAEAGRFPELGASYYSHGPKIGHEILAQFLANQAMAGVINCDDPVTAADDFWGMILHHDTLRRLYAVQPPPSARDVKRIAAYAVSRFLRLYPLSSP